MAGGVGAKASDIISMSMIWTKLPDERCPSVPFKRNLNDHPTIIWFFFDPAGHPFCLTTNFPK